MMLKIGLTGGIGSGKSLVADIFRVLDIPVYEADEEAKVLMQKDPELKRGIIALLGVQAYENDQLNRRYIAEKVFPEPDLLARLNALVHPAVHRDFNKFLAEHSRYPYVIEEAAILYESGQSDIFDYIIVVDAPDEIRIKRVIARDGVPESQVRERMKHQMPADEKKNLADFVIENDGRQLLVPQLMNLHNKFVSLVAQK